MKRRYLGTALVLGCVAACLAQAQTDPLDHWHSRNSLLTTNNLYAVAYDGGQWVSVGQGGTIMTSTNGTDWALQSSPTESDLVGLGYGGGRWVAVGPTGTVITSTNGSNWMIQYSPTLNDLAGVAYGNGLWVAVGGSPNNSNGGTIMTSSDGVTWNARTLNSSLKAVAYGNGQWIAVGAAGAVLTSSDGVSWTVRNSGTTGDLYSVHFGDGEWVAGALISTNGITWVNWTTNAAPMIPVGVAYGSGQWVGVGAENFGIGDVVRYPEQGNWVLLRRVMFQLNAVAYGAGEWMAVGNQGGIVTSINGIDWNQQTMPNSFMQIGFRNSRWLAMTSDAVIGGSLGVIASSADGFRWTDITADLPSSPAGFEGLSFGNGQWLTVDAAGHGFLSSDGLSWTPSLVFSYPQGGIAVAFGNGQWMVSDYNFLYYPPPDHLPTRGYALFNSSDGTNWSSQVYPGSPSSPFGQLVSFAYGAGQWVAVGRSPAFPEEAGTNAIFTSRDTVTWNQFASPTTNQLRSLAFSNGQWVAAGDSGAIVTSSDGTNWTVEPSGTSADLSGVGYGGGQWVAVGTGGTILSSTNGAAWTIRNSGTSQNLSGVAFGISSGIGSWVVVGQNGTILQSDPMSSAPVITDQPVSQTNVAVGSPVTLTVEAIGTEPLSYQWEKDGALLADATNASYQISVAQTNDTGSYQVTVSNPVGSVTSSASQLTVLAAPQAPQITHQPSDQTGIAGDNVSFNVAATGSPAPTFQWQKDGTAIDGATDVTYTVSSLQANDAGNYRVLVSNPLGSVLSSNALLTVIEPVEITQQPVSQSVLVGGNASLTVAANGTTPSYEWQKNGAPIDGATGSVFNLTNAQVQDLGDYNVVVGNEGGSVTSTVARVTVIVAPTIRDWTNWHARASLSASAVAYGNGRWVAVGKGGMIATSPDGANWTRQASGTTNDFGSVAYGNGRWVAAIPNVYGGIITSVDGVHWSQTLLNGQNWPTGPLSVVNDVTYGDGLWVAVGGTMAPTLTVSPDGVHWTSLGTAPSSGIIPVPLRMIGYGDGLWLTSDSITVYQSFDATNWAGGVSLPPSGSQFPPNLWDIGYGNGQWFISAGGPDGPSTTTVLFTSLDGTNWVANSGSPYYDTSDAFWTSEGVPAILVGSGTGAGWTVPSSVPNSGFEALSYGQGTWVAVGADGTLYQSDPVVPVLTATGPGQLRLLVPEVGNYRIDASTNLADWTPIVTLTDVTNSAVFTGPAATNDTARFYRAVLSP